MVVTQPRTIFNANERRNYRYILKLNKLTWLTSHRRLVKELMIIFLCLFFCFCFGFVFVLDLTKTKIFSGLTYLPLQQSILQVFYPCFSSMSFQRLLTRQ